MNNVTYKSFTYKSYIYKQDLAFNNPQALTCHKHNQTKYTNVVKKVQCLVQKDCLVNECPGYDTKQSDGKVPVMLELWGMRSTPSLLSLQGLFFLGVGEPDKGPIYGLNRTQLWFDSTVFGI